MRALLFAAAFFMVSCASDDGDNNKGKGNFDFGQQDVPCTESPLPSDAITVEFNDGGAPSITNNSGQTVGAKGENVEMQFLTSSEYNVIVSGVAKNGSVKIYGNSKINLYLKGANITNSTGPAINIQGKSSDITLNIVCKTKNNLADGATYQTPEEEDAKGTFFSKGFVKITGGGNLDINSKYGHAIVVDDSLEINAGTIMINESAKDGVHANKNIYLKGGVLKIKSRGDGVQSERENVIISGGVVLAQTADAKADGINAEMGVDISGSAKVQLEVSGNGAKGINSTEDMKISGGNIEIITHGNEHTEEEDTSNAAGIKADGNLSISGGTLDIKSLGNNGRGINSDGNVDITGGNIHIESIGDGIKLNGNFNMNAGSLYVRSSEKDGIDCDGQKSITGGTVDDGTDF